MLHCLHAHEAGACTLVPHLTLEAQTYTQICSQGCERGDKECWDVFCVLPVTTWERISNSLCPFCLLWKTFCIKAFQIDGLSVTAGVFPKWASFLFVTAGAAGLVVKACCSLPLTQHLDPCHSSAFCLCSQPREIPMPGEKISQQEITFNAVTMLSLQEASYPQFAVLQLWQASLLLSWENRAAILVIRKNKSWGNRHNKRKSPAIRKNTKQTAHPTKRDHLCINFTNE